MTLSQFLSETRENLKKHGGQVALNAFVQELWQGFLKRAFSRINYRPTVWRREWDTLIILDACRADALESVIEDDSRFPDGDEVNRVISPSSTSSEFMRTQFSEEFADDQANTALVCANAHTRFFVDHDRWEHVEEVWNHETSDEDVTGVTPPRTVTDVAIDAHRSLDVNRVIVWYMQPHFPARKLDQTGVFKKIRDGQLDYEQVWEAYVDNLQWVLDDIALLLKNVDAETVAITSDHGDSFGEYGVYGHAQNIPIPPLKHVPWLTVSAEDSGEYKPEMELDEQVDEEVTVEERLSALGYR